MAALSNSVPETDATAYEFNAHDLTIACLDSRESKESLLKW